MPVEDVTNETDPGVDVRLSAMGDPLLLSISGGEGEAAFDTGPADFSCSAAAAALWTAAAAITFFSGCGAFGIEVAEISWCWLLQQQPLPKACRFYSTSTRTTTTTTATFSSSSFSTPGSCLNARFKRWLVCIRFVSCSQRCMATFRCFTASTTTSTLAPSCDVVFLFDRLGARGIICFFFIDDRSCGRTGNGGGGGDSNPALLIADGDPGAALAAMILVTATGLPPLLNCVLIGCCSMGFVDDALSDTGFNCDPTADIRDTGDV
uniref:Uncharacterized protein n=1 Tax=Anopheles coluzzii TaxID=1518534 RepID=A0A8W7PCE2_ANOCL